MISVLIPTYNYTCYRLVCDLQRQLEASNIAYEVIVADDGSRDQVSVIANLKINELPNCRYLRQMKNIGRAAIRNLLIHESQGDWLLFMDSDALVMDENYIDRYVLAMNNSQQADIIVGGLRHPEVCPTPFCTLRYRYEKEADLHRGASERNLHPFAQFSAFNVAFKRHVFDRCLFDETCVEYGYEDTLLGYELEDNGFNIAHIDNPIIHIGLEPNDVYLRKVRTSINTLKSLGDKMKGRTKLQQTALQLQKHHIAWGFRLAFAIFSPFIRKNLLSQNPDLRLFAIYKLGMYLRE